MPLEIREINAEKDFPALTRRLVEAYEEPMQSFVEVYLSPLYQDKDKRDESIEEMAERLALWHTHDPSSYWQKIVDTETGEIAGGALWNIHEENPFAHQHELEATWFPEDGSRKFAEAWLEQYGTPRALKGQRPQVYLFILFTIPKYRRRGVAQQFMNWGKKKADKLGVEMFLDATPMGRPLYEANGFTLAMENIIDLKNETADEAWKEAERRVGPVPFYLMWRPAGGSPWESAREKDLTVAATVNANRQQLAEAVAHF